VSQTVAEVLVGMARSQPHLCNCASDSPASEFKQANSMTRTTPTAFEWRYDFEITCYVAHR
jgi:hypothetical protein